MAEARDKYVTEHTRDLLFNMKQETIPKGVWLSTVMMSAPLFTFTTYLAFMSPMAGNVAMVDPSNYAYVARSCLRLLGLNLTFFGGVHYGFGSAQFDVARSEEEKKAINYQLMYAFVPGIVSFGATNLMLFASPLTTSEIFTGFTALMFLQVFGMKFDSSCVKKELAPVWFTKYRKRCFYAYMALTVSLYTIYYFNYELINRKNDPNRIENVKSALQLEDLDFVKMVDDLKIQFDEQELAEVERQISSKMRTKVAPSGSRY